MKRQTGLWVRKAEADLIGARSLERTKPPLHDLVCFHCQQAAEKYLKALVQELGLVVPRTHNLADLLTLLLPHDAALRKLRRGLISLGRYAVGFRYPGENASKRQSMGALRQAEKVRRAIRDRLGLPP
jgi:HEPN domain-containing protein